LRIRSFPRTPILLVAGGLTFAALVASTAPVTAAESPSARTVASLTYQPPPIGHVWTIILENKSYEATFTGLNKNDYLWKKLPSYGLLLRQYYGTGHYSLDNYISAVSGQSPRARQPERLPAVQGRRTRHAGRRRSDERNVGMRLSRRRQDALQPAAGQRRQLEGVCAGHGQQAEAGARLPVRYPR
jgi:hypothetical protein